MCDQCHIKDDRNTYNPSDVNQPGTSSGLSGTAIVVSLGGLSGTAILWNLPLERFVLAAKRRVLRPKRYDQVRDYKWKTPLASARIN
jgi:hypothetical protein